MLVFNLKNYVFGKKILDLVSIIDIYCNKAIIAVPSTDITNISNNTTLPIYAQHVDYQEPGKSTGFVLPESIKVAGAQGSLLNHSEHKISFKAIKQTVARCNDIGLKLIICASNLREAEKIKKLDPYAIAFEDPKLIGTGKSITTYDSKELEKFVFLLQNTKIIPFCGAGITSADDVQKALTLGCKGILVSSIVANSPNPENFLKETSKFF